MKAQGVWSGNWQDKAASNRSLEDIPGIFGSPFGEIKHASNSVSEERLLTLFE
jgi:hypothetical protein